jgi:hypothetical protein
MNLASGSSLSACAHNASATSVEHYHVAGHCARLILLALSAHTHTLMYDISCDNCRVSGCGAQVAMSERYHEAVMDTGKARTRRGILGGVVFGYSQVGCLFGFGKRFDRETCHK